MNPTPAGAQRRPLAWAAISIMLSSTGWGAATASGQSTLEEPGPIVRCALESLAVRYRQVLSCLESLGGGTIETIHIVGGGTQNRLLCQFAADACQRPVVAGPVEATAIGNLMMQAMADGAVSTLAEARQLVRDSFEVESYQPQSFQPWAEAVENLSW